MEPLEVNDQSNKEPPKSKMSSNASLYHNRCIKKVCNRKIQYLSLKTPFDDLIRQLIKCLKDSLISQFKEGVSNVKRIIESQKIEIKNKFKKLVNDILEPGVYFKYLEVGSSSRATNIKNDNNNSNVYVSDYDLFIILNPNVELSIKEVNEMKFDSLIEYLNHALQKEYRSSIYKSNKFEIINISHSKTLIHASFECEDGKFDIIPVLKLDDNSFIIFKSNYQLKQSENELAKIRLKSLNNNQLKHNNILEVIVKLKELLSSYKQSKDELKIKGIFIEELTIEYVLTHNSWNSKSIDEKCILILKYFKYNLLNNIELKYQTKPYCNLISKFNEKPNHTYKQKLITFINSLIKNTSTATCDDKSEFF